MEVINIGDSRVIFLPVIRGLVSEERNVEDAFNKWQPDSVALSISKEEVETLKTSEMLDEPADTFEEEVYVSNLTRFGDVRKPPPCFTKAVELSKERGVECVGVDMTDEEYTEAYCHFVSAIEMMRESWFKGRLRSKTMNANSPQEFVLRFDKAVNKTKGHKELEAEREKVMAHRIRSLAKRHRRILAVIELERSAGVLKLLRT